MTAADTPTRYTIIPASSAVRSSTASDRQEPTDDGNERSTVIPAEEVGDLMTVHNGQAWVCVADVSKPDDGSAAAA